MTDTGAIDTGLPERVHRKPRAPRWAVALVFVFGATSGLALGTMAWRDAQTREVLARVRTALERTSFSAQARFSCVIKGEPVQLAMTLEHWHDASGGPRSRTRDLELVEASAEMRRWFEMFAHRPSAPGWGWRADRLPLDEHRILDNYAVRIQDAAPRDGRATLEIAIAPRHRFRPRAALLVDQDTGLPLELSLYSHTGALENAGQLSLVRYGTPEGSAPTDAPSTAHTPIDRDAALRVAGAFLEPRVLPAGYGLAGYYVHEHSSWRGGEHRHVRGAPGTGSEDPPGSGSVGKGSDGPRGGGPHAKRAPSLRIEYSDGLARLFLIQFAGEAPKPPGGKDRSPRPVSRVLIRGELAVEVDELGGRTMARTRIGTTRIMLAGMASPDELADCLASLVPADAASGSAAASRPDPAPGSSGNPR